MVSKMVRGEWMTLGSLVERWHGSKSPGSSFPRGVKGDRKCVFQMLQLGCVRNPDPPSM